MSDSIKIKTGEIVPMPCPECGNTETINRISMSAYNNNGFKCACGFEIKKKRKRVINRKPKP